MKLLDGIVIAIVAGAMNGLFALPMKTNKVWAWENNWLPFSFLSLALFPWLIAWFTVPHLGSTYLHTSTPDLAVATLCGMLVYTGSLLFGISIPRIGIALSFALLVGTMNAVGVMVPRLLLHRTLFGSRADRFVLAGIALSLLSVFLGFIANRGKYSGLVMGTSVVSTDIGGALLAIAGGALSGLLPVGMAMPWAQRLLHSSVMYGKASPSQGGNAVLAVVLLGGAIPNCGYCLYLLRVKKTFGNYVWRNRTFYWAMVLCMGLLYSASVALWGVAISPPLLGPLGPSVGWALFVGAIVLASTTAGVLSGEWRHSRKSSIGQLIASLVILLGAMISICYGNYLG